MVCLTKRVNTPNLLIQESRRQIERGGNRMNELHKIIILTKHALSFTCSLFFNLSYFFTLIIGPSLSSLYVLSWYKVVGSWLINDKGQDKGIFITNPIRRAKMCWIKSNWMLTFYRGWIKQGGLTWVTVIVVLGSVLHKKWSP